MHMHMTDHLYHDLDVITAMVLKAQMTPCLARPHHSNSVFKRSAAARLLHTLAIER